MGPCSPVQCPIFEMDGEIPGEEAECPTCGHLWIWEWDEDGDYGWWEEA